MLLFLCVVLFVLESSIMPELLLDIDLREMGLQVGTTSRIVVGARLLATFGACYRRP